MIYPTCQEADKTVLMKLGKEGKVFLRKKKSAQIMWLKEKANLKFRELINIFLYKNVHPCRKLLPNFDESRA